MTRLTIAPQLAVGSGLWTRPLLRAFYSRTFWNRANQPAMASNAPSYSGSLDGQAMGLQAELWF
jgi:maltoporin